MFVSQPRRRVSPPSPRVALVIAGAVVLAIVLYLGSAALGPFIVGLVLAYLLDMPVERMSRIGFPRWLAVLIVYAITVFVVVEAAVLTIRPLADEMSTFIREFPSFMTRSPTPTPISTSPPPSETRSTNG